MRKVTVTRSEVDYFTIMVNVNKQIVINSIETLYGKVDRVNDDCLEFDYRYTRLTLMFKDTFDDSCIFTIKNKDAYGDDITPIMYPIINMLV